jgi:hypothetical protein
MTHRIRVGDLTDQEAIALDRVIMLANTFAETIGRPSLDGRRRIMVAIIRDMPGLIGDERARLIAYLTEGGSAR